MQLRNLSPDAYALDQASKRLYTGRESITVTELTDPEIIIGPILTIIVNAILTVRFGTDVFKLAEKRYLSCKQY